MIGGRYHGLAVGCFIEGGAAGPKGQASPNRGARGDTANEFEKRESLEHCREIFLSLKDEPFVRIIDSSGSLDDVARRIREAVATA